MIELLYFADKHVRRKLFESATSASHALCLVSGVRHGRFMKNVTERDPFAGLEREIGDLLHQILVVDEGAVEGMWRDPLGDLADALFPGDRAQGYLAASGYLILKKGQPVAVVKKHGAIKDDLWFLAQALHQADDRIPAPHPSLKPGPKRRRAEAPPVPPHRDEAAEEPEETTPPPRPRPRSASVKDPWKVLGIDRGASSAEAKKAFRALIAQYHPDKVAHLGPEFRDLAEERTRQILAAWEAVESQLGH